MITNSVIILNNICTIVTIYKGNIFKVVLTCSILIANAESFQLVLFILHRLFETELICDLPKLPSKENVVLYNLSIALFKIVGITLSTSFLPKFISLSYSLFRNFINIISCNLNLTWCNSFKCIQSIINSVLPCICKVCLFKNRPHLFKLSYQS